MLRFNYKGCAVLSMGSCTNILGFQERIVFGVSPKNSRNGSSLLDTGNSIKELPVYSMRLTKRNNCFIFYNACSK